MADILRDNNSRVRVDKQPSLKLNALSNWVVIGVGMAIGFFLTPAIFAHLGEKRFGVWMLVSSIVGYFGLLQLGVGAGVLRYGALFHGKGNEDKVNAIVSTGMAFFVNVGLAIFITSYCFADVMAAFFQGGRELALLIRIVGLAAAVECPSLIFDSAIKSREGFVPVNLVTILGSIIRAISLFSCICMGYGLVSMGWALVIVTFIVLVAKGITFRICCPDIRIGIRKISLSALKPLVLYGLAIVVGSVGNMLTSQSSKLVIGKVVSLEAVGFFGIVCLLLLYCRRLVFALSKVFMPRFSYLTGQTAEKEIRQLFLRGSRYVVIVAGAVTLWLCIVGPSFLQLWMKNDNINQAIPALIILTAGTLILLSHRVSTDLLLGLGKQYSVAAFAIIEGLSVLGLSLLLSFKYGMTGVAVGASVPLLLVRGIVQAKYVCGLLRISFWRYHTECILKPWIIAITIAGASYWLGVANFANNWPFLFLVSGLIVLVYSAGVYMIAIETEEKRQIKERFLAVLGYGYT